MQSKISFEAYSLIIWVKIRQYNAINGTFKDNTFMKSVKYEIKSFSFFGFNAHFQNGKVENSIIDLQVQSHKQIHHVKAT